MYQNSISILAHVFLAWQLLQYWTCFHPFATSIYSSLTLYKYRGMGEGAWHICHATITVF